MAVDKQQLWAMVCVLCLLAVFQGLWIWDLNRIIKSYAKKMFVLTEAQHIENESLRQYLNDKVKNEGEKSGQDTSFNNDRHD